MSLLYNDFVDKTEINVTYCFAHLFYECPIVDASKLVINLTKVTNLCCSQMFNSCSLLKSVINIRCSDIVTSDNYAAFDQMFVKCSNIEIHYLKDSEEEFGHFADAPTFGASNATIYYDL